MGGFAIDPRLLHSVGVVGIVGKQDPCEPWHDLPEEFQALWGELERQSGHSRDGCTGPGEALDEAHPHRIPNRGEDDGDLGGGQLRCLRRVVGVSEEEVHPILHQLPSGRRQGGQISCGEADAEDEVLVLAVAQLHQAISQAHHLRGGAPG